MGRRLKRQYKYGYLNLAGPAGHQVEVVYDPSHCQQWAPAGSVPDDWFEHPVEKMVFPRFFAPVNPDMATSRETAYIRIDGLHDPVRRVAPDGSESKHWWTLGNALAAEASGGWIEISEPEALALVPSPEQRAREEREARARDIVSRLTAGEGPWVRVVNIPILGCTGMCLPNDRHAGQVGRFCGDAKDTSCRVQFADTDVAREGHNLEILTLEQAVEALWAARDAEGKE